MEEVSMRSFASAINKPMLFQIGDELGTISLKRELQNSTMSIERKKWIASHYKPVTMDKVLPLL
ncbi:MAG: hypothetical protein DME44_12760 [Verrucomicrobia bacterium]|nr:MAG: hypothetical protein DME44_12760 [Verrucomicrobiota bacterium]